MILEIAEISVIPGMETEFEVAFAQAGAIFRALNGWVGAELHRSVERPSHFRLIARWQRIEDHTVVFRTSPAFKAWRALVGHCFAGPPEVEHLECLAVIGRGDPSSGKQHATN